MLKRSFPLLLVTLVSLAAVLLAGCGGRPTAETPLPPPACPTPAAGSATLCGQVSGAAELWPDEAVMVFAAPFTPDGNGNGFYFLEPVSHPHGEVEAGGLFRLADVPPGKYVLIVGPEAGRAQAWLGENGKPRTVTAEAGEAVELGVVDIQ